MPIDFESASNRNTYASRMADDSWIAQIQAVIGHRSMAMVADVGCGGGIYSRAWKELGADSVIGIDASAQMVADAAASTHDATISYRRAPAEDTGLADESCSIVFSRAVVHHLPDTHAAFAEAFRILQPGGLLIVQDRTIDDVLQPASPTHLRGWFFELFPRLIEYERQRRPESLAFGTVLERTGFSDISATSFWETRRTYVDPDELRSDLLARTGRSILHELSDKELAHLTEAIVLATTGMYPLAERDRWTMWTATKPINR